jgi:hypothetical protein
VKNLEPNVKRNFYLITSSIVNALMLHICVTMLLLCFGKVKYNFSLVNGVLQGRQANSLHCLLHRELFIY